MKHDGASSGALRFGVVCEGPRLRAWEAQCLDHLLASPHAEVSMVIVDGSEGRPDGRAQRRDGTLWRIYREGLVARRSWAMRPIDTIPALQGVPVVGRGDIDALRRHEVDVILHLGPADRAPQHLAGMARHGLWTFRHGRASDVTGDPACFWEVLRGHHVTHVGLTAERSDGRGVLRRAAFRTHGWSYVRNLDAVHRTLAEWPAQLSLTIRQGILRPDAFDEPRGPERRTPRARDVVGLALLAIPRIIRMQARSLLTVNQWHVGVVEAPIRRLLDPGDLPPVRWLPLPGRNRFLADPFGLRSDGHVTIVMEEFDHRAARGRVVCIERDDRGHVTNPECVLEAPSHVSYPFLLEWNDHVYCIPYIMAEAGATPRIDLFRAREFPRGWVRVATLIEGFPAQDPTVFRHNGLWWLLCGRRLLGSTALHGWYADELTGPWQPHPGNPLKIDIRSSRPAGTPFVHEGTLYRPAQDESREYGGAIAVNRVVRLSPTEFEEETVTVIGPEWTRPYDDGVHTIAAVDDITLVDAKRRAFVWPRFRRQLRIRLWRAGPLAMRPLRGRLSSVDGSDPIRKD